VLEIDANPCPRLKPAAHPVDEHIGRFEMRRRVRMLRFPSFQSRTCIRFVLGPSNLDQRAS